MIIAIDGPAGSGKSTVARGLAERLGFRYLDTGAMYRALTWVALEDGIDLDDGPALETLALANPVAFVGDRVVVRDTDVTEAIREPRIDRVVSSVARHPEVRSVMKERQRELGEAGDAVIEGRDIGTVVCPDAEVKVYLVADPGERARPPPGRPSRHRGRGPGDRPAAPRRAGRGAVQAASDAEQIDTTEPHDRRGPRPHRPAGRGSRGRVKDRRPRLLAGGKGILANLARAAASIRAYGTERIPRRAAASSP